MSLDNRLETLLVCGAWIRRGWELVVMASANKQRETGLQSLIRLLESCDQLTSFPTLTITSIDHMTLSDQSETAAQFGEASCLLADAIATHARLIRHATDQSHDARPESLSNSTYL